MTRYLVTAIVQDNREDTMKVCARTDDTFNASKVILLELAARAPAIGSHNDREQLVRETWAIHSLHIDIEDDQ